MKRSVLILVLLCSLPMLLQGENRSRQQGTIVRMRMVDCMAQHAFMSAMSGAPQMPSESCPEYVLVTNSVVYVIIGKNSNQLLPLAESTYFHFQHNAVLIRVDDARRESHFHVKEMVLRPEWERSQQIVEAAASAALRHHLDTAVMSDAEQ